MIGHGLKQASLLAGQRRKAFSMSVAWRISGLLADNVDCNWASMHEDRLGKCKRHQNNGTTVCTAIGVAPMAPFTLLIPTPASAEPPWFRHGM